MGFYYQLQSSLTNDNCRSENVDVASFEANQKKMKMSILNIEFRITSMNYGTVNIVFLFNSFL